MHVLSHHAGPDAFSNIAEELRCHILSFLSYREIIRCALTCQAMYKTVENSTELQYIIELGAQKLMPIHPRPLALSIAECLRILRDKANAWSSFELTATKSLRVPFSFRPESMMIAHQRLGFSAKPWPNYPGSVLSKVVDIRTCTHEMASVPPCIWDRDYASPAPGTFASFRYIDEIQDLMITTNLLRSTLESDLVYVYHLHFYTISTDEEHPLAHASRIQLTCRPGNVDLHRVVFTVLGDRLAFCSQVQWDNELTWSLHIWNWHEGGQPDDIYVLVNGYSLVDMRFLTKEKLLTLTSQCQIELYNVENLSTAPQLQARFMLPITSQYRLEYHSVFHSASSCAHLAAPDERWIWTSIPENRVICLHAHAPASIFVISARPFFMDIPPTWFDVTSGDGLTVPWSSWGPQNSRCFLGHPFLLAVGGSRVIRTDPCIIHMLDFNPSAVARGIGNVVREPKTLPASTSGFMEDVTTYLPYVDVVNNDRYFFPALHNIIIDEERMLISEISRDIVDDWAMEVEIIGM